MSSRAREAAAVGTAVDVPALTELAHRAFDNKGGEPWRELQRVLYAMNERLLGVGAFLGGVTQTEIRIRDVIERAERDCLPEAAVPRDLTTRNRTESEDFFCWLQQKLLSHRINTHPLFDEFERDDVDDEECRRFLTNCYLPSMRRCRMHLAAHSRLVPLAARCEAFFDMYVRFGAARRPEVHAASRGRLREPIARESDYDVASFRVLNTAVSLCWFAEDPHRGLGALAAAELCLPAPSRQLLGYLRRRRLDDDLGGLLATPSPLALELGDAWFAAGARYTATYADFQRVYEGATRMLEARAALYDRVLDVVRTRRKTRGAGRSLRMFRTNQPSKG